MSTIEDFENAPVGATATHRDGSRAMKMDDSELGWIIRTGHYWNGEVMARWGYTLDPATPTTARGALDLPWDLAHEVKEGQHIPECTPYLMKDVSGLREYTKRRDFEILPELVPFIRTVEPLQDTEPDWSEYATLVRTVEPSPEPEPDWLDAPAVLARHVKAPDSPPTLWANLGSGMWGLAETTKRAEVWDLRNVTPLYPKEDA